MEQTIRRYRSDWNLSRCGQYEYGLYRSRWYCGLRPGMEWLRLSLKATEPILVKVYTTDRESGGAIEEMEPVLERAASDILLYGVNGRFLCFTVEPGNAMQGYELTFPGLSIDSQLPAVMQGNDTLRKLLGVYQSLYMDLNRDLRLFPDRLTPLAPDPLPELPRWLGVASWMGLGLPEQELLSAAVELNQRRGTAKALSLLAMIITGQRCKVVEHFQWYGTTQSVQEREDCARLYGENQSSVTILFPDSVPSERIAKLKAVLDDFIPLGVPYSVVCMEDSITLDGHSYLDSGLQITDPAPAKLDESEAGEIILE